MISRIARVDSDWNDMAKIALTGARGFLGWHVRCAAASAGIETIPIPLGDGFDLSSAAAALSDSDEVIHLAGVNRGSDEEVEFGNERFARQLAEAIARAGNRPARLVVANSIQAGSPTPYGRGKALASGILSEAADRSGIDFRSVLLPNLFGEHGRPFYNSVVATFAHQLAVGEEPRVDGDRALTLLHAQDAADVLLGTSDASQHETVATVREVLDELRSIASAYADGTIPDLSSPFRRDLFNTYRAASFDARPTIPLQRHADARGSFFELVRVAGGGGQSSFSTTVPGVTRGEHYHRRKIERFIVLSGEATISMRRLFHDEVVEFHVRGDEPAAVDMPTMWSHDITNTGAEALYTAFWINEVFDPSNPDTYAEKVQP